MQQTKKLHVINVPAALTNQEFNKAIQQVCQLAKGRVYPVKAGQQVTCGDVTFPLQSECEEFLRQVKVKPLVIMAKALRFEPYREKTATSEAKDAPNTFQLVGHIPERLNDLSEADALKQCQFYFRGISKLIYKPVIANGVTLQECKTVVLYVTTPKITAEQICDQLKPLSVFRLMKDVDVKDAEKLAEVRVLVRNLPNCTDVMLVKQLQEALKTPFKHLKRVKNFCFVTFYDERDAVSCVKLKEITLGKRIVVPDFTSDAMREKHLEAIQLDEVEVKEKEADDKEEASYSYSSESEQQKKPQIQIETFDKNKPIETYLNPKEDPEESEEYSESESEPQHTAVDPEQPEDLQNFVKENTAKPEKFSDEFTIFVQNVPTRAPLDVLQDTEKDIQQKGRQIDPDHLVEVTVRRQLANIFLQFGKLRKVALTMADNKLKGQAFIQFEREQDFDLCLSYEALLRGSRSDKLTQKVDMKWAHSNANAGKALNDVKIGQLQDDVLFQQQQLQREMDGLNVDPTIVNNQYAELDAVRRVSHRHIDLQSGTFKLFENNLIVYKFVPKKQLSKQLDKTESDDPRHLKLLKYALKIPGVPGYDKEKFSIKDEEFRVRHYHRQKHLLENVNFHVSPTRIEVRNVDRQLNEDLILCNIWLFMVKNGHIDYKIARPYLTGQIPPQLKVNKWADLLDVAEAKKQSKISSQQMKCLQNVFGIIAIRAPVETGKCFELIRNLEQARKQAGQLTGSVFIDTEGEAQSKRIIDVLDNQAVFDPVKKPLVCFVVEDVGRLREVRTFGPRKPAEKGDGKE